MIFEQDLDVQSDTLIVLYAEYPEPAVLGRCSATAAARDAAAMTTAADRMIGTTWRDWRRALRSPPTRPCGIGADHPRDPLTLATVAS